MISMRRITYLSFVLVLALAAIPPTCTTAQSRVDTIAIENARIVTVSGATIERGTVVIRGGRIVAVGSGVPVPAGARRIDGEGKSVYPGFIDSATGLGLAEIASVSATVDLSELGEYNTSLEAYDAVNPSSELIPAARFGGVTTVVSFPQGGTFSGQPVMIDLGGWTVEEMVVARSVGLAFSYPTAVGGRTFDVATFSVRSTPDSEARKQRDKKLEEIEAVFEDARAYTRALQARKTDPSLPPLEHDLNLEALIPVLEGTRPVIITADDASDIRSAIEFCEKHKLKMILRAEGRKGADELTRVIPLLAEKRVPVILGTLYRVARHDDDRYDLPQQIPGLLAKAGVLFAFSSNDAASVRDLPYSTAMAVAYGTLSKEDAIRSMTLWPARIWGVEDRLGSIAEGRHANLIVTDGDPMEVRTKLLHVFVRGVEQPLENRQTVLSELYRKRIVK